jgi:hypothetical protein
MAAESNSRKKIKVNTLLENDTVQTHVKKLNIVIVKSKKLVEETW